MDKFKDKYTTTTAKEEGKKVISDDAYAIGELLETLIIRLGAKK